MTSDCIRISIMTFNVWGNYYWPHREPSLRHTFEVTKPDVILLQESSKQILHMIDSSFPIYDRVHHLNDEDIDGTNGWITESNIVWNKHLFELLMYGCEDVGMKSIHPNRGLFWVILKSKINPNLCTLFSTVHFPWVGLDLELSTHVNQRIGPCLKCCDIFNHIIEKSANMRCNNKKLKVSNDDGAMKLTLPYCATISTISNAMSVLDALEVRLSGIIFTGDFNEDFHPLRLLQQQVHCGGLIDVFASLELTPPHTHPGKLNLHI